MFNSSKLRLLADLFRSTGFQFVSLEKHLGLNSVKVLVEPYPSYYYIAAGRWFRHDVPYPGATAPVEVPEPTPLNVPSKQSPGVVWVMAMGFSIDRLRRRVYPLTDADVDERSSDWTPQIEESTLSFLDNRLALIESVAQGSKEPGVKQMARAVLATQLGQIREHGDREAAE